MRTISGGSRFSLIAVKPRMSENNSVTSDRAPPFRAAASRPPPARPGWARATAGTGRGSSPPARSARQHGVVDGGRGLVADAGEDLQILFAKGVGRHHGIQVHDAEQLVVVDERHGHGGTDALHDDGTRTLKRLSMLASEDSTAAFCVTTSLRMERESTICSVRPSRVFATRGWGTPSSIKRMTPRSAGSDRTPS